MADEAIIGNGMGLDILCASAVRSALTDCAESFHRASGIGVKLRFDTSGGIAKRAAAGDEADIYASSLDFIEAIAAGGLASGKTLTLGSSRIAMGVRANDTAPDISTLEKFAAALRAAKAYSRGDPAGGGTAGTYLHGVLDKLGLLETTGAQSILRVGGYKVMTEVAEGRADFGLTQSTEIAAVAGVKIGAWLPDEIQIVTLYALVSGRGIKKSQAAQKFITYVAGVEGQAAFKRAGFAPA